MRKKGPGVFEQELGDLESKIGLTTVGKAVAWAQGHSIWPDTFGLACCAMEMIAIVGSRYDVARFGAEVFRSSPRQADLMIVSGRVSHKMAAPLRQIYDQMLEPKWVIAMGACSSSMGVFNNYAIVPADKFMPVYVHVPGCPPRPEALMHGIFKLRQKIMNDPAEGWRERYEAIGNEEIVRKDAADEVDPLFDREAGEGDGRDQAVNVFKPGDTAGA